MDIHSLMNKITGISKEESKKILKEVTQNQERLSKCSGPHKFELIPETTSPKYKCTRCNGVVDSSFIHAYNQGIQHGGKK